MSETIEVYKKNNTYIKVVGETSTLFELADHFTFMVPGAQYTPKFRNKIWDGKIRLFNRYTGELYVGLLESLKIYCAKNGLEFVQHFEEDLDDWDEVLAFINSLQITSGGNPIEIRDYQLEAVKEAVTKNRSLLLSPTGSGKSLILYLLMRWNLHKGRRQLLLVPQTSLVEQMYKDFEDYSSTEDWDISKVCSKIYGGMEKTPDTDLHISTWQSLFRLPKKHFHQYDVVYADEVHLAVAKSLTGILENCLGAPRRIGTTGTLDGTKTNRLVLEGLFGSVCRVVTTKTLMDDSRLAPLKITCVKLVYNDEERKAVKKMTYQEEISFLVEHKKRNIFLRNLALAQKGNTLLLFQFVERHGKVIHEMIKEKAGPDRPVFFVHGDVPIEEREDIRAQIEKLDGAIVVASFGVFSTGVNLKNLHNLIFASPTKSRIRNLQSIGRALRTSAGKTKATLFDIGDDLTWKTKNNTTLDHLIERIKIYNQEQFDYKIVNVPLAGDP